MKSYIPLFSFVLLALALISVQAINMRETINPVVQIQNVALDED